MIVFRKSLSSWNSDTFASVVKQELESLDVDSLPLAQCTSQGGYVDEGPITATILSVRDQPDRIDVKAGIFFTEIVINCGCGDDPMPINGYGEMSVQIDKSTGHAAFLPL
jgi:hypothetical protein